MATGPRSTLGRGVDSREVRPHLDKVLASPSFAGAPRVQQFLRFVVEETLEGRAGEIKESVVAVQVFGRRSDFDSHRDSLVRVQATHLRKRLREYYRTEGLDDGMVIDLPSGTYLPAFRPATARLPVPTAGRGVRRSRRPPAGAKMAVARGRTGCPGRRRRAGDIRLDGTELSHVDRGAAVPIARCRAAKRRPGGRHCGGSDDVARPVAVPEAGRQHFGLPVSRKEYQRAFGRPRPWR